MNRKKSLLFLSLALISSNAFPGPFGFFVSKQPAPKGRVDQIRQGMETGFRVLSDHKKEATIATVGAGAIGAGIYFRKPIISGVKKLYSKLCSSFEAHPHIYKAIGGISSLGALALVAHKNGLDEYLASVAQEHPFLSGFASGTIGAGAATLVFLKNVLNQNTQMISSLNESKERKEQLCTVFNLLCQDSLGDEFRNLVEAINDEALDEQLSRYDSKIAEYNELENLLKKIDQPGPVENSLELARQDCLALKEDLKSCVFAKMLAC